jgi:hypothetical protein
LKAGDAGGEVQTGLTLNRNRLKRNRAAGAAHEHIRAQAGEE